VVQIGTSKNFETQHNSLKFGLKSVFNADKKFAADDLICHFNAMLAFNKRDTN